MSLRLTWTIQKVPVPKKPIDVKMVYFTTITKKFRSADGSPDKGTCHTNLRFEFNCQNAHKGERKSFHKAVSNLHMHTVASPHTQTQLLCGDTQQQ